MNALLALRPCKAFGRSTSGIHARPRKRGGGTADKILWLAVQYSDSPAFTILKLFRAVTVGIVNALEAFMIALLSISISYAPSSLSKTALPLALHHHPCLPCQREVLSPEKIRATTGGIALHPPTSP